MPSGDKRQPAELARDRRLVAMYYLQRKKQDEIAELTGLSQSTVSNDLKFIQKEWKEAGLIDLNVIKKQELQSLDLWEAELTAAWEKSKLKRTSKTTRKIRGKATAGKDGVISVEPAEAEETTDIVEQIGDARYFQGIMDVKKQRAELLGLNIADDLSDVDINLLPSQIIKALSEGKNLMQALIEYAIRTNSETSKK